MGKNLINVALFGLGRIGLMHANNLINNKNFNKKPNKNPINFLKVYTNRIYLPWVEKYRPNNLNDIILDKIIFYI